jgi:hypothetical protein
VGQRNGNSILFPTRTFKLSFGLRLVMSTRPRAAPAVRRLTGGFVCMRFVIDYNRKSS